MVEREGVLMIGMEIIVIIFYLEKILWVYVLIIVGYCLNEGWMIEKVVVLRIVELKIVVIF